MPKKKLQRKKTAKIFHVKKKSRSLSKKSNNTMKGISIEKKIHIILKNLILFGVLFILSVVLYNLSSADKILSNFFWILGLITGAILLAFIISYLVFFFLRSFKK